MVYTECTADHVPDALECGNVLSVVLSGAHILRNAPLFLPENTSDTVVTLQAILHKAAESCDYFLKDYGNDGCCEEGAQYYRHAGLCLYGAMTVLNTVTDGHFDTLFRWDKVKNIASYILNVHVNVNTILILLTALL